MWILSPTRMVGDVPNVTVIVVSEVHAQYAPEPRYASVAVSLARIESQSKVPDRPALSEVESSSTMSVLSASENLTDSS